MTRRSGRGRVTRPPEKVEPRPERYPSLRERKPFTFWMVIIGTLGLLLGTFGSILSAFL